MASGTTFLDGELIGGYPLAGRAAVVTGAGRGIGWAIAQSLARLGAEVTLLGRTPEVIAARARELTDLSGRPAHGAIADILDEAAVERAFTALSRPADILVNNAGAAPSAPFARTNRAMWDMVIGTNLTGAYLCTRQVLPGMVSRGWGRVVNIASTAGLKGYAYTSAYCAAKHGLVGLTRSLALETAKSGVTVNAVCPGFTDTDLARGAIDTIAGKSGRSPAEALAAMVANNPQGRLVAPQEVAEAVAWLCLPASASVTGQSLAIAGGEVT